MTEITEKRDECGKDEMNLAEFPITLISNRHRGDEKTLEYSDTITVEGKDKKIKAQIEALPFRSAKEPAALLIRSIQEDWAPTAEHKNNIESKKRTADHKAKKKEKKRQEAERRKKIEDYLGSLSEEEKKALEDEALGRAMQDGGSVVRRFGVHEGMFEAYLSMVVEERLELKV